MLIKLDQNRASMFRSTTIRASYMSIILVDMPLAVKEEARFMGGPNEGA